MRPRLARVPLLAVLLTLTTLMMVAMASPARATIGPDIRLRLVDGPTRIAAGDVVDLRITVETAPTSILADLRASGAGWLVQSTSLVPMQGKQRGLEASIRALVTDPTRPLVLESELDGRLIRRELDLSPRALAWLACMSRVNSSC